MHACGTCVPPGLSKYTTGWPFCWSAREGKWWRMAAGSSVTCPACASVSTSSSSLLISTRTPALYQSSVPSGGGLGGALQARSRTLKTDPLNLTLDFLCIYVHIVYRYSERGGYMRDKTVDEHATPESGSGAGDLPNNWLVPAVLLLLRDLSSYGYDLMRALSAFGFAMMNPGPLYRMLRQMEKDGLVRSSWDTSGQGPARRIYSITEAGEAYLRLWASSLGQYRRMMDRFFRLYKRQPEDE